MEEGKGYLKLRYEAAERAARAASEAALLESESVAPMIRATGLKRVTATFGLGSAAETATFSLLVDARDTPEEAIAKACKMASAFEGRTRSGTGEVFLISAKVDGTLQYLLSEPDAAEQRLHR